MRLRPLALTVVFAGLVSIAPGTARACGWDRDTVWLDAVYMRDVLAVLAGRFPRSPPLFYEMRLARTTKWLGEHPGDLAAYDDAGNAADHLGRADEAIAWMDKKRARVEALPDSSAERKEHLYRYLANQGTFYVHRWARSGAPRDRLADVEKSRDLLKEAIRLNPDAHFGRERYQVMAVEWLISPPAELRKLSVEKSRSSDGRDYTRLRLIPTFFPINPRRAANDLEYADAVRGLAGLVALGSAWESVDVFHNLAMVLRLRESRPALAAVAGLRARELLAAGKGTLYPNPPKILEPAIAFPLDSYNFEEHSWTEIQRALGPIKKPQFKGLKGATLIEKQFHLLRQEAEAWNDARNAYMMSRLTTGAHPDTHPDFWQGFHEPATPHFSRAKANPKLDLMETFEKGK